MPAVGYMDRQRGAFNEHRLSIQQAGVAFTSNARTHGIKYSLALSDVKLRLAMEEYTEDFHNTSRCHSSPAVLAQTLHETTKATRLHLA